MVYLFRFHTRILWFNNQRSIVDLLNKPRILLTVYLFLEIHVPLHSRLHLHKLGFDYQFGVLYFRRRRSI